MSYLSQVFSLIFAEFLTVYMTITIGTKKEILKEICACVKNITKETGSSDINKASQV
jgi:hypothetical protein